MKKSLTMLSILTVTLITILPTISYKIERNSYNLKSILKQSNHMLRSKTDEKTDADRIKDAIEALSKIENEEVLVARCPRSYLQYAMTEDVKKAVKELTKYQDAIKELTLKKDKLTLEKINSNLLVPFDCVEFGEVITVKGKVQSGIEEKSFQFTVKVKEKSVDRLKLEHVIWIIGQIEFTYEIKVPLGGIDITCFKNRIKNLPEFIDVIDQYKVELKNDCLTLKRANITLESKEIIYSASWITVEGAFQIGIEEKDFAFKIWTTEKD